MRTNIVLDDELIKKGFQLTGLRKKTALVHFALKEMIRRKQVQNIMALQGVIHWEGDLKKMRKNRI